MAIKIFGVNAFASQLFHGNPAGVVISPTALNEEYMQQLASELQFSETAFIVPMKCDEYSIRWFTPTQEALLCGHATLAAAHALWTSYPSTSKKIHFLSVSGTVTTSLIEDTIEIILPTEPCRELLQIPPIIKEIFSHSIEWCGQNRMDYLVQLQTEALVHDYVPDFQVLKQLGRGVILTAKGDDPSIDFVCRVFAPSDGIPEDPVTGSAFCALAPFWAERLHKMNLLGKQVSSRGAVVPTHYRGKQTHLYGTAITLFSGKVLAPNAAFLDPIEC